MQTTYRRAGHSVSALHVHLVLVTKYRRRVINHAILTDSANTTREVCDNLGAELVESNGETDHVHLLGSYPPTVAISDPVRRLKGATALRMRADYTGRCNQTPMHRHLWTPSYSAVSAGRAPLAIIKQYIENQAHPLWRAGRPTPD